MRYGIYSSGLAILALFVVLEWGAFPRMYLQHHKSVEYLYGLAPSIAMLFAVMFLVMPSYTRGAKRTALTTGRGTIYT
jgi:hypothetical protein